MPARPPSLQDPRGPHLTLVASLPARRSSTPPVRRGPEPGPLGASARRAEPVPSGWGRRLPAGGQGGPAPLEPPRAATGGALAGLAWVVIAWVALAVGLALGVLAAGLLAG